MESAVQTRAPETRSGGRVLMVTHGQGRGRPRTFLPWLFSEIGAIPELAEQVRLFRTGTGMPRLDGFEAIVFLLHDPLEEYPACEEDARIIAVEARRRGIRLVNPPEALNNTRKSRQAELWRAAGLPCAWSEPAEDEAALRKIVARVQYPIIIRFDPGHRQDGIYVCPNQETALKVLGKVQYPAVALQFVNTRRSWERLHPESVMARHFHKKRIMVFPNAVINNHIFFSSMPIVGSRSSAFTHASLGQRVPDLDHMIAADITYSLSPPEAPRLMQAAVRALGLDIAAIDYSSFGNGKIVLWEANPSFALPHWSQARLPEARRLSERNPRYLKALLAYIAQLARVSIQA